MPSLEAQAGAEQAKLWAHLLKALLKVGNDLFIEVDDQKLIFRTLNAARSAFVTAKFSPSFFDTYDATKEPARCKVLLKPLVAVFKNLNGVQSFVIRFDSDSASLAIDFECREGVEKRFQLVYEACDVLQALYFKERCGNRAVMPSGPLHECLSNFHTGVDEVILTASPAALRLGTSVDPATAPTAGAAALHTEMSFNAQEFDRFEVEGAGSVTFSIRELKAVAALLEVFHLPVSLHFDGAGSPIIFGSEADTGAFALDLVLSTLQQDSSGIADGASSSAGCGSGGVDSWSESRHSPAVGDDRRGGRGHAQPRGGKAVPATASFGSGDSIITADTTPPPSALLHTAYRSSQASSIPATDRFDLGHGGRGRRVRSTAAEPSAARGGHGADDFDSASVGGWAGADCSQASILSVPSTDRRFSVSPREQQTARCPPPARRPASPQATNPAAGSHTKGLAASEPALVPPRSGRGGQTAASRSRSQSPEEGQRHGVKRRRIPEAEDQESDADMQDGRVDDMGGVPGRAAANVAEIGAGAACASEEEEEDEFVDATPSPPPR